MLFSNVSQGIYRCLISLIFSLKHIFMRAHTLQNNPPPDLGGGYFGNQRTGD
jgi:hypothetical protein